MVKCLKHEVEMEERETDFEYGGVLLRGVKVWRCPMGGEELFDLNQYGEIKRRLDSVIKPLKLRRRISTAGNRPIVYLPMDVLEHVKAKVGDEVQIYTEGDRIILQPVKPEEEPKEAPDKEAP